MANSSDNFSMLLLMMLGVLAIVLGMILGRLEVIIKLIGG